MNCVGSSIIACMSRAFDDVLFIMCMCVVGGGWVRCIRVLLLQRSEVPDHVELQLKSVMSYPRAQGPKLGSVQKQQIIFTTEPAFQLRAVNINILRIAMCIYIYIYI